MLFVDVNVLLYAHRPESPEHEAFRQWLEDARSGPELLGLSDLVLTGFLRIATNHRVYTEPTPTSVALSYVRLLQTSPAAVRAVPTARVWDIVGDLVESVGATANTIQDIYLAAAAIDLNATMVTADHGFARFEGLRMVHPLSAP